MPASAATSEIAKPIDTAIAVSLMCSTSAGWSTGSQFSRTQSVQKSRFSATQSLASPKSGMTGSAAISASSSVSRSSVSCRFVPSPPSTTTARAPSFSIAESASRSVVCPSRSGPTAPFAGSSSSSSSRVSERRFSPRSAPTKRATKSSAGWASSCSGVSYWASTPPSRRIAIRSPTRIASSMSWVTKMIVLRSSCWIRSSSFWSLVLVIGSSAPNGSSISISGGSAASARASPTRWRSPPEICEA